MHAFPDVDVAASADGLEQGRFAGAVLTGKNGHRRGQFEGTRVLDDGKIERIRIGGRESVLRDADFLQVHNGPNGFLDVAVSIFGPW
jgi:hypothetical protein